MTRSQRIGLLVSTHALAIAVGACVAYEYFLRDGVRGMTSLGELSVSSLQEMYVDLQRDVGTDQEYEDALRQYLSVLDRLRAANPDTPDATGLRLSKTVTLGRLALVAEKRHANAEAAQFMDAAVRECTTFRKGDCSAEKIREWAVYFDKSHSAQTATK